MKIYKKENVFLFSIVILILTSIFSVGYHHFDEHFQILEVAGSKLDASSSADLPWEFHQKVRGTIQPTFVVGIYKFLDFFSINNPFTVALFLRLLSALLAFTSMYLLYRVYSNTINKQILKKWFFLMSFFLWFICYNGVRFSSENWSGMLFVIGFSLYFLIKKKNNFSYLIIGSVLGISFLFRYQIGFLIAGFILWILFIKKDNILRISFIIIGLISILLLGIFIDKWFYGEWEITIWNYAWQYIEHDIIQGKGSRFGSVDPWWWYIKEFFFQGIPPFSLLFILSIILLFVFNRNNPLTWIIFPFLLVHFLIGHKEMRFLFPIIYFLPIILIQGFQIVEEKYIQGFSKTTYMKIIMKGFFILNFIYLIGVMFKPADPYIKLYKTIYQEYKEPTVLYYISKNPFTRVYDVHKKKDLAINFYKRTNLQFKHIDSLNNIELDSTKSNLIVLTEENQIDKLEIRYKQIYSTIPEWALKFNINNWLSRVNRFYVYEIYNPK